MAALLVATSATAAERVITDAMAPSVAGDGRGGFVLSWYEPKTKAVKVASLRGETWSAPHVVASGETVKANRADTPQIAVSGDTIVASYSVANAHGRNIYVTRSTDGGATWSRPQMPHPAMASEFGFVSLSPGGEVIWLDGRGLPGGHEGAGDMQFHASMLRKDGTLSKDETVDARVCDCCPTAMAMTSSGAVVAYRDRSDEEIRDVSIVRHTASGWSKPVTLRDGWQIKGCPVNGPQLDARGRDVVIAWFTGAGNDPRVQVAFSRDGGATFGKPVRIDAGKATGRVDVAFLGDGAVVSYLADGALHLRRVSAEGKLGEPLRVGEVAGFPRLAVSKENVAVVYGAGESVRFTTIDLPRD